jgi:hypothetical protein
VNGQLVLRCLACRARFTIVDVCDWTDVNDVDQLLDVAIDFCCPECCGEFVVELDVVSAPRGST